MARPENHSRHIRSLGKVGGKSFAITIPIDIVQQLDWKLTNKLLVRREGSKIIIEKLED
jgi:bifunctional DNA-binding transcriptional regulator/antitoxin component of YhaV-PrlF toxin-antitoxin module